MAMPPGLQGRASESDSEVDLALLFASPLVFVERGESAPDRPREPDHLRTLQVLNLRAEGQLLMKILGDTGKRLVVRRDIATVENFRYLVTRGCRAVHYSGHGYRSCLAFENEHGALHDLEIAVLKQLFAAGSSDGQPGVRFVFVSACHSQEAGQLFVEAGVPHVVVVDREKEVEDTAARKFALQFYHNLVKGSTVREAFDVARSTVAALAPTKAVPDPAQAARLFILLPEDGSHEERIFPSLPDEPLRELDAISTTIPPYPDDFVGRNIDLYRAVKLLRRGRLTTLFGESGVGKSALALAVAHWAVDRRIYPGGVVWAECRGCRTAEDLERAVRAGTGYSASDGAFSRMVLARGETLLCLDDCDDLFSRRNEQREGVFALLGGLVRHTGTLSLLLTLSDNLDRPIHIVPNGFALKPLSPRNAAMLMSRLTRWTEGIRIREVLADLGEDRGSPVPRDLDAQLDLLAKTRAMQLLDGNPARITLAAARYNEVPGRRLSELATLLEADAAAHEAAPAVAVVAAAATPAGGSSVGRRGAGGRMGPSPIGAGRAIAIADAVGRAEWDQRFGHDFAAPWDEFQEALLAWFSVTPKSANELRPFLVDTTNEEYAEQVTQESFNTFLKWFGPFGESVPKASDLYSRSWFHGFLSSEDAVAMLHGVEVGSFLVRFSNTFRGQFIVNFVMHKRSTNTSHTVGQPVENIYNTRGTQPGERRGYTIDKKTFFPTLNDFIAFYRQRLSIPLHRQSHTASNYETCLSSEDAVWDDMGDPAGPAPGVYGFGQFGGTSVPQTPVGREGSYPIARLSSTSLVPPAGEAGQWLANREMSQHAVGMASPAGAAAAAQPSPGQPGQPSPGGGGGVRPSPRRR